MLVVARGTCVWYKSQVFYLCPGVLFECVGALLVCGHPMWLGSLLLSGATQICSGQDHIPVQDQGQDSTRVREGQ